MRFFRKSSIFAALFSAFMAGAAEIPWFNQDFENRNFFSVNEVKDGESASAGKHTGFILPHARIVEQNGNQAFRLERIGTHRSFNFSGLTPIPAGRDFVLDFDLFMPEIGGTYFFFWDKDDRKLTGLSIHSNAQIKIPDQKEIWGSFGVVTPTGSSHFRIKCFVNESTCQIEVTSPDGKIQTSRILPMVNTGIPARLEFGTIPTQKSAAVLDNIKVSYSDHRPVTGRKDVAPEAQIDFQNFSGTPGALTLKADSGKVNMELASMSHLASIRVSVPEDVEIRAIGFNNGGQRMTLAENDQFIRVSPGVRQADFKAVTLRSVYLEFSGKQGSKVSGISLYEDKAVSQLGTDDLFIKDLYGEFALPVYGDNGLAELHLFNETAKDIPVKITLKGQKNAKVYRVISETMKPGKNSVNFELSKLGAGYYVAEVVDNREPDAVAKGRFRRLLRRQLLPEPAAPETVRIAGQKLFFPDAYYLESSSNIDFHTVQAETYQISKTHTVPELHMQHGLGIAIVDGKLISPYQTLDNYFRESSERRFMATASFDDLDNWEIKEIPLDYPLPKFKQALAQGVIDSDWNKKPGPDGKINYQFYDPEKDGPVDVKQIQFQYVHWMAAGTLGGEEKQVWGDFIPEKRTTWPIWYKAPGEARILTREPLYTDNRSSGEFELPADSNDNFCGQWLSDDGKYVYYCRGHVVRRYPPYNVSYDNLANGLRLLTICRTKDGINFERSFVSIPGRDEPLAGTQHYGGTQFRMKQGNGLRILLNARYYARDQRMFIETAYSWDGFNWKRFEGEKPLADNGEPGQWMCGGANLGVYSAVANGKVYYPINWAGTAYHIMAELIWDRDFYNITGSYCKSYMQPRGFDNWPLWKYFRDYDHIAEYLRNATTNTGMMVWREDGLFYLEAKDIPGVFVTKKLIAGQQMSSNLEIADGGEAVFTLLDANGHPIPGQSRTFTGPLDSVEQVIFSSLPQGEFKVQVQLKKSRIYTLSF